MERYMTIGTDSIITYILNTKSKTKQGRSDISQLNLKKKYTSGCLTKSSSKRIKQIMTNWILAIYCSQKIDIKYKKRKRRYLVMATLTLPSKQIESDNQVKRKYLNNFITQLKNKHEGILYLWVAEKQKNGNIHFHVVLDRYVKKEWLQNCWNSVLATGNYITEFEIIHNHKHPPSTQIQGQKDMGSPASYLTKYITKSEKSHDIEGHKWSCSSELLQIIKTKMPVKNWYAEYLYYYKKELKCKYFENDFVQVYYFEGNFLNDYMYHDLFLDNEFQYLTIYSKIYPELCPRSARVLQASSSVVAAPQQLQLFSAHMHKTGARSASML